MMARYHSAHAELDEAPPCLRCNGTGTVFHATGYSCRYGDTLGYDDDCPQCGGSGVEEFSKARIEGENG